MKNLWNIFLIWLFLSAFLITNSRSLDLMKKDGLSELQRKEKWKIVAGFGTRNLFTLTFEKGYAPLFAGDFDSILNYPALSPIGERLAFCSYNKKDEIIIYDFTQKKFETILEKKGASHLSWAPEGNRLSFLANYDHKSESLDLGVLDIKNKTYEIVIQRNVSALSNSTPSWFPDGRRLCFVNPEGKIAIINIFSKKFRVVTEGDAPSVSPDGKKIIFRSGKVERENKNGEIYYKRIGTKFFIYNLQSGTQDFFFDAAPKFLQWCGNVWQQFHWSPDGNFLLFFRPAETLKGPQE